MSEEQARYEFRKKNKWNISQDYMGEVIMEKNYKAKIKITAEKEVMGKAVNMGDAVRKFEKAAEEIGAIDKWEIRTSIVKSIEEM